MRLNNLKPAAGSKSDPHRVGRGIGSGWGKTAGRGHKGQKSRAGGFHKVGFEGGQMPLHRRLPKRGFTSLTRRYVEVVRLSELQKLGADEIDLGVLKQAGIVSALALDARVIKSGELSRKLSLRGIGATKGAKAAIEAAGGSVAAEAPVEAKTKRALAKVAGLKKFQDRMAHAGEKAAKPAKKKTSKGDKEAAKAAALAPKPRADAKKAK